MVRLGEIGQNCKAPTGSSAAPLAVTQQDLRVWSRTGSGGSLIPAQTFSLGSCRCSFLFTSSSAVCHCRAAAGGEARRGPCSPLCRALLAPDGFCRPQSFPACPGRHPDTKLQMGSIGPRRRVSQCGLEFTVGIKYETNMSLYICFTQFVHPAVYFLSPTPPLPPALPYKPGQGWLIIIHDLSHCAAIFLNGSSHL